jgi:hypothetical protein
VTPKNIYWFLQTARNFGERLYVHRCQMEHQNKSRGNQENCSSTDGRFQLIATWKGKHIKLFKIFAGDFWFSRLHYAGFNIPYAYYRRGSSLDALYEARCKLLVRADASPDDLFFPETKQASPPGTTSSRAENDGGDAVYPETLF